MAAICSEFSAKRDSKLPKADFETSASRSKTGPPSSVDVALESFSSKLESSLSAEANCSAPAAFFNTASNPAPRLISTSPPAVDDDSVAATSTRACRLSNAAVDSELVVESPVVPVKAAAFLESFTFLTTANRVFKF